MASRATSVTHDSAAHLVEIALRAGYSDRANFHRAHIAIIGTTSARFRSLGRADPLPS